jgi:hypothetical protein
LALIATVRNDQKKRRASDASSSLNAIENGFLLPAKESSDEEQNQKGVAGAALMP